MKVSFDIECTPEEARTFFGLPDLSSVHELYVDKLKSTITEGVTPGRLRKDDPRLDARHRRRLRTVAKAVHGRNSQASAIA